MSIKLLLVTVVLFILHVWEANAKYHDIVYPMNVPAEQVHGYDKLGVYLSPDVLKNILNDEEPTSIIRPATTVLIPQQCVVDQKSDGSLVFDKFCVVENYLVL